MAGMGLQGAYGAMGTLKGVQDWINQRREAKRFEQDNLLFDQQQEDRRLKIEEEGAARAQEATARDQRGELLRQIDELDLPPLAKLGAKISIAHGKELPPQLYEMLKAKEAAKPVAVDTVDAQGRPVQRFVTPEAGQEFPKYVKPEEKKPDLRIAPNGQVVDLSDPNNLNRNFAAPKDPKEPASRSPQWVMRDGKWVDLTGTAAPGDLPPQAIKPPRQLPVVMQEGLVGVETARDLINQLGSLYEGDAKTPGVKTLMGPAAGRWLNTAQGLPQTGIGLIDQATAVPPQFSQFAAATARLRNATIKAITGAAMSEPEAKRIMQELPSETNRPDVWLINARQALLNLKSLEAAIQRRAQSLQNVAGAPGADAAAGAGAGRDSLGIR